MGVILDRGSVILDKYTNGFIAGCDAERQSLVGRGGFLWGWPGQYISLLFPSSLMASWLPCHDISLLCDALLPGHTSLETTN